MADGVMDNGTQYLRVNELSIGDTINVAFSISFIKTFKEYRDAKKRYLYELQIIELQRIGKCETGQDTDDASMREYSSFNLHVVNKFKNLN